VEKLTTSVYQACIFKPDVFSDDRGHFLVPYNLSDFRSAGIHERWIQDNQSKSMKGTLRGLHFQKGGSAQAKLVRCVAGSIYDVIVDLRPDSPSYLKWAGFHLNEDNHWSLYVPKGLAHGFLVLSETAIVQYKVDYPYEKSAEDGLRWDDPALGIEWPETPLLVNPRDQSWPLIKI
jgi:dTDP-4-dehydrorhamnose 3,5-epimerase